jgi:hypothetical protein
MGGTISNAIVALDCCVACRWCATMAPITLPLPPHTTCLLVDPQMWFLAEGRVHHVHVTVSRTLYLDSEVPLEEGAHLLAQGTQV